MFLRYLKVSDAPYMLEWMHDLSITQFLKGDFQHKVLKDCVQFINDSKKSISTNLHLAIVDSNDTYMGTASLKHIDALSSTAEFAIVVRTCAQGKGYAQKAMQEIILYGKEYLGLTRIYWCVNEKNIRAIRFYTKNNYCRTSDIPGRIKNLYKDSNLIWFSK